MFTVAENILMKCFESVAVTVPVLNSADTLENSACTVDSSNTFLI